MRAASGQLGAAPLTVQASAPAESPQARAASPSPVADQRAAKAPVKASPAPVVSTTSTGADAAARGGRLCSNNIAPRAPSVTTTAFATFWISA